MSKYKTQQIRNKPFKIAFLFLLRDDLNYPEIWENYFKGHQDKISIYCHPKNPENVKTEWLKSNIIPKLVETKWGKITDAYFTLINEALKNSENKKFITVSESCLPLKSFNELYNFFDTSNIKTSYIKFWYLKKYDIGARLNNRTTFVNIRGEKVPIIKHYARFCLSRYHALKLLNYTENTIIPDEYIHNSVLDMFNDIEVGDEFFLSILEAKKNSDYIMDFEITYDNWERVPIEREKIKNKIKQLEEKDDTNEEIDKLNLRLTELTGANPYSYHEVNNEDVEDALKKPSFLWRKFPKDSNIANFYSLQGIPFIIDPNFNICLLFLTYSNIIHINQLSDYFENCDIYIHAKNPKEVNNNLQKYLIPTMETKWADKSIIIATLELLKQSFKNKKNKWFILCSQDIFPLLKYNECYNYLYNQKYSIFDVIDNTKNKTSQFWALNREDVSNILSNKSKWDAIFDKVPRKAAFDELFFLPLLKQIKPNYKYTDTKFCYVKWFDGFISKHPTVFNCLLKQDSDTITSNHSCFIRKTYPTFKNTICPQKPLTILITFGTESITNYEQFIIDFKDISNIFILSLLDNVSNKLLTDNCSQTFFVVWNDVDNAINVIKRQFTGDIIITTEQFDLNNLKTLLKLYQNKLY
jgi:hypothetical protein